MEPTLNAAVRQNLLSMQNTARMLSQSQTRLATGKKVNSALDNPSAFFQAKGLSDRAQALTQLLDQVSIAQSTVEAANNGLDTITDLVGQARGIAQQALQAEGATSVATATNAFAAGAAGSVDVTVDGVTTTVSYSATDDAAALAASISSQVEGATAEVNGAGQIEITSGDGRSLAVGAGGGFTGAETVAITQSETRTALAAQFNEIRTQINEVARDAGFNGVNLLEGDSLSVLFNENSASSGKQSSLTLEGQTVDSVSLGISQIGAFNATSNPGGDFQLDTAISAALDELTGAVDSVERIASSYASDQAVLQIREDFTNDMINTLQAGADKLTLADPNEEGAKMLALQTRQELASTALALSTQAEQSVLRLF